jgi:hypothetical protein
MSAEEVKAARIRAPNDFGRTANDFGGKLFDCTTTHQAHALPASWKGKWIILHNRGSVAAHFAFSAHSDAEVDPAATAIAAGEEDKVGEILDAGEKQHRLLPKFGDNDTCYFVRECASSTTSVHIALGTESP